jgi:hypothetical protein
VNQTCAKRLVRCQLKMHCVGEKVFFRERSLDKILQREVLWRSCRSFSRYDFTFVFLPLTAMTHKFLCFQSPYISTSEKLRCNATFSAEAPSPFLFVLRLLMYNKEILKNPFAATYHLPLTYSKLYRLHLNMYNTLQNLQV